MSLLAFQRQARNGRLTWLRQPHWAVFVVLVLLFCTMAVGYPDLLSSRYLLQQIQVAAFVGVFATGMMLVLLVGEIDLSLPWTATVSGMLACGLYSSFGSGAGELIAVFLALLFGVSVGLWNGLGVAVLRAPSMVWTLGTNALLLGASVFYAGGYNPQTRASPFMRELAVGRILDVIPLATLTWAVVGLVAVGILRITPLGIWIYSVGRSARVSYLAAVPTRTVLVFAFVWSGLCFALGGILLAGYSGQAFQAMGDPMLLPTVAAVVLGGTKVTGGEGNYIGTIGGVLVLTFLSSVLSLLQAPQAVRLIIYGLTIVVVLLATERANISRNEP